MALKTDELVGKSNSAHQFDNDALFQYCSVHVDGFPVSSSKFSISQVSFSASIINPDDHVLCSYKSVSYLVFCNELVLDICFC